MTKPPEIFISVDVETSGPIPGEYSLLSIGACYVDDEGQTFSRLLKPISTKADPKALEISGLSLEELSRTGLAPQAAMAEFAQWIESCTPREQRPVFLGFNAPFDWSFINYYFHKFLGTNPFGFSALDIKALYMGATGSRWDETRSNVMDAALKPKLKGNHDALRDAQYQAELFRLVRARIATKSDRH